MKLNVIGGGLAGSEAAWQAAQQGIRVNLFEMRPLKMTGAHQTGSLGELVCSNSLGSNLADRASGLLKNELRKLGSLLIACADASSLPAGSALAVDREAFSSSIQEKVAAHPKIDIIREEVTSISENPTVVATGPLTSPAFESELLNITGDDHLYFYDAIAPIVDRDSVDMNIAFRKNRYDQGGSVEGDYINCPLNEEEYHLFRNALIAAKRIPLRDFEQDIDSGVTSGKQAYFQGCQPIEIIAMQGEKSLAFGPMRPVGLTDPHTGKRPFAVLQLRQDNLAGDLYNMVGFQTNLTYKEQVRVFKLIPGLKNAVFTRFGQMHRNMYIASPLLLESSLMFKNRPGIFAAGQITGIEGYAGSIASGLLAGINAARFIKGMPPLILPLTTMTGSIIHYITHADMKDFQPMKAMFGLLPKPEGELRMSKKDRFNYYSQRALTDLDVSLQAFGNIDA